MREEIREMVAYLLKSKRTADVETIDSYTDTLLMGVRLERERRKFWMKEYTLWNEDCAKHADKALKEFDKRFKP